jgi:hypothetical protein
VAFANVSLTVVRNATSRDAASYVSTIVLDINNSSDRGRFDSQPEKQKGEAVSRNIRPAIASRAHSSICSAPRENHLHDRSCL